MIRRFRILEDMKKRFEALDLNSKNKFLKMLKSEQGEKYQDFFNECIQIYKEDVKSSTLEENKVEEAIEASCVQNEIKWNNENLVEVEDGSFQFEYGCYISYLMIYKVTTDIDVIDNDLKYKKEGRKQGIFKSKLENGIIAMGDIKNINVENVYDKGDVIFAIMFLIAGFFIGIEYLILAIIFGYFSRGVSIKITTEKDMLEVKVNGFKHKARATEFLTLMKYDTQDL